MRDRRPERDRGDHFDVHASLPLATSFALASAGGRVSLHFRRAGAITSNGPIQPLSYLLECNHNLHGFAENGRAIGVPGIRRPADHSAPIASQSECASATRMRAGAKSLDFEKANRFSGSSSNDPSNDRTGLDDPEPALCPVPNAREAGWATFEFQKLAESGTFRLRNVFGTRRGAASARR